MNEIRSEVLLNFQAVCLWYDIIGRVPWVVPSLQSTYNVGKKQLACLSCHGLMWLGLYHV